MSLRFCLVILVSASCFPGCSLLVDRSVERIQFEKTGSFGNRVAYADLTYDGRDEVFHFSRDYPSHEAWLLSSATGGVIDQISIPGTVMTPIVFDEIDGDESSMEVLVPVNRSDSLFLYAYNAKGKLAVDPMFIASGPKRLGRGNLTQDWTADARFELLDLDQDGQDELISIVNTGHAYWGRGIYVHELSGQFVDSLSIGAAILNPAAIGDIDGDGVQEMLFASAVPRHGADIGGYSDDRGYLLSVNLQLPLRAKKMISSDVPDTEYAVFLGDFEWGEGELIVAERERRARTRGASMVFRYSAGSPIEAQLPKEYEAPRLKDLTAADLDGNGLKELYAIDAQGRLLSLEESSFRIISSFAASLETIAVCPDIDGDGNEEICINEVSGPTRIVGADGTLAIREHTVASKSLKPAADRSWLVTSTGDTIISTERVLSEYLWGRYGLGVIWLSLVLFSGLSLAVAVWALRREERSGVKQEIEAFVTALPTFLQHAHRSGPTAIIGPHELRVAADLAIGNPRYGVREMARRLSRSERQLLRACQQLTGLKSRELLLARRLNESARLLASGRPWTDKEMESTIGWGSTISWRDAFSDHFGKPPESFAEEFGGRGYTVPAG